MLVGDLQRIIEYPARGFAIAQQVPPTVMGAYRRLADPAATARRLPDILRQYYRHGPHAAAVLGLLPRLQATLASSARLTAVAEYTTTEMLRLVGWPGVIYHSSDLPARSGRSERLADLASTVGATTYLCGTGGSRYLDPRPS